MMDANVWKENATSIFRIEGGHEDEDSMLLQKKLTCIYNAILTPPQTGRSGN
jgi:hypothetical protein